MSQFWWDDSSAETLGQEALDCALAVDGGEGGGGRQRIGVLSAPSVWFGIDRLLKRQQAEAEAKGEGAVWAARRPEVLLLEYDTRFGATAGEW